MKKYDREHYTLKSYKDEKYSMIVETGPEDRYQTDTVIYADNIEELYVKAKKEAKAGKKCTIWELKYDFIQ